MALLANLKTLLAAGALFVIANTNTAEAITCPSNIPPVIAPITQMYNGGSSHYNWVISPTSLSTITPTGVVTPCEAAYVTQYSTTGNCNSACNVAVGKPSTIGGNRCVYTVSDGGIRTMTLAIGCDSGATSLRMDSTVQVTDSNGGLLYSFTGAYAGVCDSVPTTTTATTSTTTSTPTSTTSTTTRTTSTTTTTTTKRTTTTAAPPRPPTCPPSVPPVIAPVTQLYNGEVRAYTWLISPTALSRMAPPGTPMAYRCGPAYVAQYNATAPRSFDPSAGRCLFMATSHVDPAPSGVGNRCVFSAATRKYSTDDGGDGSKLTLNNNNNSDPAALFVARNITIALSCDPTATAPRIDPVVHVSDTDTGLMYSFTGAYSGVCGKRAVLLLKKADPKNTLLTPPNPKNNRLV